MTRFDRGIERLDDIERTLAQYPRGLTVSSLARKYGVNRSTIHRDFGKLEGRGTGLIKDRTRWRLDHRRTLYATKFTPAELVALFVAARLLSRYSDEHNPHVVTALAKFADALRVHSPLVANHIQRAADAVRDRPVRPEYVEAFEVLTRGWLESRKVRLVYYSYPTGERTDRLFSPYFIEPSDVGFSCYAIGMDELRSRVRTLKLDRIREAHLTDERFPLPDTFDPYSLLASAWGIIWSDDPAETLEEVRLRFSPRVMRRIKESTWHPSQRLDDLPDGSCLLTVRVGSTLELKPWIRQWGLDVEVLAPPTLRREIAAEMQELAARYSDSRSV